MNAPCWDTGPEGHLEVQGDTKGVEVDLDHRKVIEGIGYDRKQAKSVRNKCSIDMNMLCWVRGLQGPLGEGVESGDAEGHWEYLSNCKGIEMDGIQGQMDSATSDASNNLKCVDTRLLAGDNAGQHEQCKHETAHIPEPFRPHEHQRWPMDQLNPPHCRGWLKTKSRRVSWARSRRLTYQVKWSCQGHIGWVRCIRYVYRDLGWWWNDCELQNGGQPHIVPEAARTLAKLWLAMSGNRSSIAYCHLE